MLTVTERARRYVQKCAPAVSEQGGHNQTFHVASVLVNGFALSEADAMSVLQEYNRGCLPPWSVAELVHKVRSAGSAVHQMPRGYLLGENVRVGNRAASRLPQLPPKAAFNAKALQRVAAKAGGIQDMELFLAEQSPLKVVAESSLSFLWRLYPPGSGEQVILFNDMQSQGQLVWRAEGNERLLADGLTAGPDGVWFLPQPVTGEFHPNPRTDGKLSRRSEEAVTCWRYLVLESDEADPDLWLRALVQMPLRIVSICESGGRSIHALVRVDAESKADWDALVAPIKPILITLGADPGALTAVRLTRLPQAQRGSRLQRLLYLNPEADGVPILAKAQEVVA